MSPLLTDDEFKVLESTPDGAAVAKKLKDAGDYIPKSRFDEVITERNTLAAQQAKIDADRKAAEDDRMRKAGEFEKVEQAHRARIAELEKLAADEKAVADEYRTARQARVDAVKKELGDNWLPEFESLSMASLDKLSAQRKGAPPDKPDSGKPGVVYQGKTMSEMTPAERERYIQAAKNGEFKNQ